MKNVAGGSENVNSNFTAVIFSCSDHTVNNMFTSIKGHVIQLIDTGKTCF